jgi:hypothetical protein
VAAAALVVRGRERRCGRALEAALREAGTLADVADAVVRDGALCWAGLVRWDDAGRLDAVAETWHDGTERPDHAALVSWLLRETDSGADLLRTEESELGRGRVYVAAPLEPANGPAGYLVLGFAAEPPRWLEGVLLDVLPELERTLVLPAAQAPSDLAVA